MGKKPSDNAITELTHAIGLIVRRVRAAGATDELSWSETSVLARLVKEGPATTAELARVQGMKPQSMRTIVGALEGAGLIERTPHETDGRQVNLSVTKKGAGAHRQTRDAKRTWLAKAIGKLERGEQETLFEAGRIMARLVEKDPL